jgi:hypothetical protein
MVYVRHHLLSIRKTRTSSSPVMGISTSSTVVLFPLSVGTWSDMSDSDMTLRHSRGMSLWDGARTTPEKTKYSETPEGVSLSEGTSLVDDTTKNITTSSSKDGKSWSPVWKVHPD